MVGTCFKENSKYNKTIQFFLNNITLVDTIEVVSLCKNCKLVLKFNTLKY